MDDPVRPLIDELVIDYDTRYTDPFGRGAAVEKLNRCRPGNSLARMVAC
ncbi:hypothetical protein [Arthrobacter sp. SO3]|nr:hypothetical protein [Arthrobacter sp. SO3]MCB5292357.1 hypothetical protein [Arthrobacter sp. SO3]